MLFGPYGVGAETDTSPDTDTSPEAETDGSRIDESSDDTDDTDEETSDETEETAEDTSDETDETTEDTSDETDETADDATEESSDDTDDNSELISDDGISDDIMLASELIEEASDDIMDWNTWPRISPPGYWAVWTLKYHMPASSSASCASVSVAVPAMGLASAPSTGTTGGAFSPGEAGPWKCAAVASPDRPS